MLGLRTTATILLVATSESRRTVVAQQLEALGYRVTALADAHGLADVLKIGHNDLLVVDLIGSDASQKHALSQYAAQLMANGTPVLMLTTDEQIDPQAWTRETLNYRVAAALRNRKASDILSERTIRYEGLAILDPETTQFSRRYFDAIFPTEIERSRRMHQPMTLLLIDVAGPLPLSQGVWRTISVCLLNSLRQTDLLVRYSPGMVLVLLPATESTLARAVAARLIKSLEMQQLAAVQLGITIGMATFPQHGSTPEGLLSAVQHALGQAVRHGQIVSVDQA